VALRIHTVRSQCETHVDPMRNPRGSQTETCSAETTREPRDKSSYCGVQSINHPRSFPKGKNPRMQRSVRSPLPPCPCTYIHTYIAHTTTLPFNHAGFHWHPAPYHLKNIHIPWEMNIAITERPPNCKLCVLLLQNKASLRAYPQKGHLPCVTVVSPGLPLIS
jgi:hypothetical protein